MVILLFIFSPQRLIYIFYLPSKCTLCIQLSPTIDYKKVIHRCIKKAGGFTFIQALLFYHCLGKKKKSQLFTYAELVKNNKGIFAKQYPKQHDEPTEHYTCKVFFGEMLRKYFAPKLDLTISYEHELPQLETERGERVYIPDIYVEYINHDKKVINISDCEINGLIHYKNKNQYSKNRLRRETILKYFKDYKDRNFPDYKIIFSYIVFQRDDFLYNKFDFFREIFEDNFMEGKVYPPFDAYEKYLLR